MTNRRRLSLLSAGLVLCWASLGFQDAAADGPLAGKKSETIGLAVTTFRYAHYTGARDCPEGLQPSFREVYLQTLKPKERERLMDTSPDVFNELNILASSSPDARDVCSSPTAALSQTTNLPDFKFVQGDVSYGLDLDGRSDGKASSKTCAHKNFKNPDGQSGIDNQLYRAVGCLKLMRWDPLAGEPLKDAFDYANGEGHDAINIRMGQISILVEISDVDDRVNDPDITVGIYSGRNPMIVDATGNLMRNTSQTISNNPRWHNVVKGKIVNGVIKTDSRDVLLRHVYVTSDQEYTILDARLELKLRPDGSAQGILAGYEPLDAVWWQQGNFGRNVAVGMSRDCAGMYKAIHQMADGYPDPETGQCTAISTARAINAIPAYVFHPDKEDVANAKRSKLAEKRRVARGLQADAAEDPGSIELE